MTVVEEPLGGWELCTGMFRYSELAARATVARRNARDGGLFHWAIGCGDHWHVIDKRDHR